MTVVYPVKQARFNEDRSFRSSAIGTYVQSVFIKRGQYE